MKTRRNNVAYIDGANLHSASRDLGWALDYQRFRVFLRERYDIEQAYIFLGLIPKYKDLYTYLQKCGFTLIFKEVVYDGAGKAKGNCDADLVLQVVRDAYEQKGDKAFIVSSDGDYASLVKFLQEKDHLLGILSPAVPKKCSILLKRTNARIAYLDEQKSRLAQK